MYVNNYSSPELAHIDEMVVDTLVKKLTTKIEGETIV